MEGVNNCNSTESFDHLCFASFTELGGENCLGYSCTRRYNGDKRDRSRWVGGHCSSFSDIPREVAEDAFDAAEVVED